MATKLTAAQRRILEKAARHPSGRIVGGEVRTRAALREHGFIESDGYGPNGPLYQITDVGRQAIAKKAV
jgi:hypothetical protein